MENRYLYKAKRIDNGEWVIGNLVLSEDCEDGWEAIIIPTIDSQLSTKNGPYGQLRFENWHRVDKTTICQCTGLKDDNGNLIYEHDILFLKDEINGCKWKAVVEFGNPTGEYNWGWQLVQVTECEANKDILLWVETEMSYIDAEVIGNTIDNLELVESEK